MQKSVAVIDAQEELNVPQVELCLSFCNNLYGKRIQKGTDTLYRYVIAGSGGCTLTASTKLQIDCTLTWLQHEIKENKNQKINV